MSPPTPAPPVLPHDFESFIDMFGSVRALGDMLPKIKTRTVYAWRERNWIPSRNWSDLVSLARKCGFEGITYALLASFPRPADETHP